MSVTFGPSSWWLRSKEAADYYARFCPVGTILGDGSAVWCKAGGLAWIVAPNCTQVGSAWAGGNYNTTCVSNSPSIQICCICEWPAVCTRLITCGFNPCDWFIPNQTVLINSYCCRAFWDTCTLFGYWSSSECSAAIACCVCFLNGSLTVTSKFNTGCVRSVRCVSI